MESPLVKGQETRTDDGRSWVESRVREDGRLSEIPLFGPVLHLLTLCCLLVAALLYLYTSQLAAASAVIYIIIGITLYHFAVAIHEAAHGTLFRNKKCNNFVGSCIGTLVFLDLDGYRRYHMAHHKLYGYKDDPEFPNYQVCDRTLGAFIFRVLSESTGTFAARRFLQKTLEKTNSKNRNTRKFTKKVLSLFFIGITQVFIFGFFFASAGWWYYFVFWIAPLLTVSSFLNRVRLFGEHAGLSRENLARADQPLTARSNVGSRGQLSSLLCQLEKILFSPFHFNYHHEHHLFPWIPNQSLPKIHALLQECLYYDHHPENLSPSYLSTIVEVFRTKEMSMSQ